MSRILICLLLFIAAAHAQERVTFSSDDEQPLVATLYLEDKKAPTVICLPMFRNVRESYEPIVEPLKKRGINVLSLDLRGHGESAPELAGRVRSRDAELFNAMPRDVEAALAFLEGRGLDPTRVALIGASVGCSVAIRSVCENASPFRAVAVMTPGTNYLGVDTIADAKRWPRIPILVLSSEDEESRVRPVVDAFEAAGAKPEFRVRGGRGLHGTRMFGKLEGIEEELASWLAERLLPEPWLRVPQFAKDDERVETAGFVRLTQRVDRHQGEGRFSLMAFAVGDRITLGAMVKGADFKGKLRFRINKVSATFDFDSEKPSKEPIPGMMKGSIDTKLVGEQASFRGVHWITVEFAKSDLWTTSFPSLALDFLPSKGEALSLPATGTYSARLTAMGQ